MLKLERAAKTSDLSITLRKREPFFSKEMVKAVAICLTVHLGAIFLFSIATSKFGGTLTVLPPVNVVIDLPLGGNVIVEVDREENASRYLRPPDDVALVLPELDTSVILPPLEVSLIRANSPIIALLDPIPTYDRPIQVHVSGPLSQLQRISSDPARPSLPPGVFQAKFHVALENRSGKIFWYECLECPDSLQHLAEEMLHQMLFEPNEGDFVTRGDVVFTFVAT